MDDANLVPSPEAAEVEVFKPHVDVFDAIVGNHVSWVLWFENEDMLAFRTDDLSDALLDNLVPLKVSSAARPQA